MIVDKIISWGEREAVRKTLREAGYISSVILFGSPRIIRGIRPQKLVQEAEAAKAAVCIRLDTSGCVKYWYRESWLKRHFKFTPLKPNSEEALWLRGHKWMSRKIIGTYTYSVAECRIGAMCYVAGYRAAQRDIRRRYEEALK